MDRSKIIAYLNEELSEQQVDEVQMYLIEHLDDKDVAEILGNWFDDCRMEADLLTEEALISTRRRLGFDRRRLSLKFGVGIAAMVLAVVGSLKIGYELREVPSETTWNEILVPATEMRELNLPDGTYLKLAPDSRVTWPEEFRGTTRSVFLEGEVMAAVASDPDRPFIIHSGNVDVLVHGTKFNFKSYCDDVMVELMLLEGAVSMNVPSGNNHREIYLAAGDYAQFDRSNGEIFVGKLSPESLELLSKDKHKFCFLNLPLNDIVAELERSFGTKILISNYDIIKRRFLAIFPENQSLDEILKFLAANGDFEVMNHDNMYILR